jgi:hypothetical protein
MDVTLVYDHLKLPDNIRIWIIILLTFFWFWFSLFGLSAVRRWSDHQISSNSWWICVWLTVAQTIKLQVAGWPVQYASGHDLICSNILQFAQTCWGKTMKTLGQGSRPISQDLSPGPHKSNTEVPTTWQAVGHSMYCKPFNVLQVIPLNFSCP